MTVERILILDDELVIRKALEEQLRRKRYSVASVSTLQEAESSLDKDEYDLLFVDVHLPDGNGTELLERLAAMQNPPLVVIITGNGTIESAVKCMQAGAFDYLIKPFAVSQIDILLKKAQDYSQLVSVSQYLSQERSDNGELIGKSPPIAQLRDMIDKVAPTEATVLINGENGTGKELVAAELYRKSARSTAPFIKVNCAAISETLIESEFFGHEKGAFTGAMQRREGRFELANGGTILLDEISEISPKVQAKLLRVLQEREFERVGGNKTIRVDVRVIATTNRDLARCVERGDFRQDLFYRLNVFPVRVPALRERGSDVVTLAKVFAQRLARKYGIKLRGFEDAAIAAIEAHTWPGNVRELQNTIERAVILTEPGGLLLADSLNLQRVLSNAPIPTVNQPAAWLEPVAASRGGDSSKFSSSLPAFPSPGEDEEGGEPAETTHNNSAPELLEEVEKRHILSTLEATQGNRTQASKLLGISIRTLRNKISAYRKDGEFLPWDE